MFEQSNEFEQNEFDMEHDKAFRLCSDLMSVAAELGVENSFMVSEDMDTAQLLAVQESLGNLIEVAYHNGKKNDLRRMKRCPMGFLWQPEGDGWRCEGGSHYCTPEQIKEFMD